MTYRELDDSLITSDVCTQCGRCCKTTWVQDRFNKAKRWEKPIDKVPYLEAMFSQSTTTFVEPRGNKVAVVNWCPNLKQDAFCPTRDWDGNPTYKCGIYKDRPDVCSAYNCFTDANGQKRNPEYFDFITGLIERVHGRDPYKRRSEEAEKDSS